MPGTFLDLAVRAAAGAGFAHYDLDACLINRYIGGAKLGLHQDRDDEHAWAPIVSVWLGLPAVFLWGAKRGSDPVRRLRLENGRQPQEVWRCCGWFDDSLEVKIGTKRLADTSLLYCFSPKSDSGGWQPPGRLDNLPTNEHL